MLKSFSFQSLTLCAGVVDLLKCFSFQPHYVIKYFGWVGGWEGGFDASCTLEIGTPKIDAIKHNYRWKYIILSVLYGKQVESNKTLVNTQEIS